MLVHARPEVLPGGVVFLRPIGDQPVPVAAVAIDVPESPHSNAIVKGRRRITADTDLRLCRFLLSERGLLAADAKGAMI